MSAFFFLNLFLYPMGMFSMAIFELRYKNPVVPIYSPIYVVLPKDG